MRVVVLISGRGSNLGALLEAEAEGRLGLASIVGVASDMEGALGLSLAREAGVESAVLPPDWVEGLARFLDRMEAELLCLAGFMKIIPSKIIRRMEGRILNIHPSLLPAFPGLGVHQRVLASGLPVSGCTVHWVDEGVDTGRVAGQRMVGVKRGDTPKTLAARVLREEHILYSEVVGALSKERVKRANGGGKGGA